MRKLTIIKTDLILSIFCFILLLSFSSLYAQDKYPNETEKKINADIDKVLMQVNFLKAKIEKLKQVIVSNKDLIMEDNMKNMHVNDKIAQLAIETTDLSNTFINIANYLNEISTTKELVENDETRKNLIKMISDLRSMLNSLESFISNIEESQTILNKHLIKE